MIAGTLMEEPGNAVIFINYRRSETAAFADHLYQSFIARFGKNKVFRDLSTIELGDNFNLVIEQAISAATVMIVLIGKQWLTIKKRGAKQRRLEEPGDYVRTEIEIGLRAGITIIPILVGGAIMPQKKELPPSVQGLAAFHAQAFSWHQDTNKLESRIREVEKVRLKKAAALRMERERLDLGSRMYLNEKESRLHKLNDATFKIILQAMERSLKARGITRTILSLPDFMKSLKKLMNTTKIDYWFFSDMVYIIDIMGVQELKSKQRFVARSYPIASLDEIPMHMKQNRPVIAGFNVPEDWWVNVNATRDIVTTANKIMGSTIGIMAGWDPAQELIKIQTPSPEWGKKAVITITKKVAAKLINLHELRYIEAIEKPESMGSLFRDPYPKLKAEKPAKRKN